MANNDVPMSPLVLSIRCEAILHAIRNNAGSIGRIRQTLAATAKELSNNDNNNHEQIKQKIYIALELAKNGQIQHLATIMEETVQAIGALA